MSDEYKWPFFVLAFVFMALTFYASNLRRQRDESREERDRWKCNYERVSGWKHNT